MSTSNKEMMKKALERKKGRAKSAAQLHKETIHSQKKSFQHLNNDDLDDENESEGNPYAHKNQGVYIWGAGAVYKSHLLVSKSNFSFKLQSVTFFPGMNITDELVHLTETNELPEGDTLMGALYGLRLFSFDTKLGFSGRHSHIWDSPLLKARCTPNGFDHPPEPGLSVPAPHDDPCKCGINVYSLHHVEERGGHKAVNHCREVVALTQMWGKVISHAYGYRAQYARVTHLCFDSIYLETPFVRDSLKNLPGEWGEVPILTDEEFSSLLETTKNTLTPIPAAENL